MLTATVVAFLNDSLAALGWQGGEYAYTFIWLTLGLVVAGAVLRAVAPTPWRSVGAGMAWAGGASVLVALTLLVLFIVAFASWNP